jgi:hypothetical protein
MGFAGNSGFPRSLKETERSIENKLLVKGRQCLMSYYYIQGNFLRTIDSSARKTRKQEE